MLNNRQRTMQRFTRQQFVDAKVEFWSSRLEDPSLKERLARDLYDLSWCMWFVKDGVGPANKNRDAGNLGGGINLL